MTAGGAGHRSPARLTELRLGAFKSFDHQVLKLSPLTLLVGPNASGKSNALDALTLLALLAEARSVADLERPDKDVAGLRGGLSGAAPFGSSTVAVGCSIESAGDRYDLDIEFSLDGEAEIRRETLLVHPERGRDRTLLATTSRDLQDGISDVEVYSGAKPRTFQMLSSRLAVVQAISKVPTDTGARQSVVDACDLVTSVLRGVFVLDPVPGQMRGYARIGSAPDRLGTTTSAMIYDLRDDPVGWERLSFLLSGLIGPRFEGVTFAEARIPEGRAVDVMAALQESFAGSVRTVPARVMSDGTLRYLSIVATLLSLGRSQPADAGVAGEGSRTLVLEEVENGLYPTQAAAVLGILRAEATENNVTLVATTHSPALLDALDPDDHDSVVVCGRNNEQRSVLTSLIDHPNYLRIAGGGSVGRAVSHGQLDGGLQHKSPGELERLLQLA